MIARSWPVFPAVAVLAALLGVPKLSSAQTDGVESQAIPLPETEPPGDGRPPEEAAGGISSQEGADELGQEEDVIEVVLGGATRIEVRDQDGLTIELFDDRIPESRFLTDLPIASTEDDNDLPGRRSELYRPDAVCRWTPHRQ